jgi:hypothetical protein
MAGGVAFIMCYMSDGLRISTRRAKRNVHAREASQERPAGDDGVVLVPSERRLAWAEVVRVGRCWTRARKAARTYSEAGKTNRHRIFIAAANELGEQSDKRAQRLEWTRHCSCEGQYGKEGQGGAHTHRKWLGEND